MRVQAHDPAITELPAELRAVIALSSTPQQALARADVAVIATEWPDYQGLTAGQLVAQMRHPRVIDQNRFLAGALGNDARVTYVATGAAAE
jgi:UDP-N-acetyl-D-mannosaminuronate dehydrogenase